MNKQQAEALAREIVEEVTNNSEEAVFVKDVSREDGLLRLEVHLAEDRYVGGQEAYPLEQISVVANCNPAREETYAVLQWNEDTCEGFLHVSPTACFPTRP